MLKVFKVLLLLLLITAMVWLSTLWRWQTTQTDPSDLDVVVYLLLMPLILTAALLLSLWIIKKIRKTLESPLQSTAAKADQRPLVKPSEKLSAN
jgi:hypothetical protein